MMTDIRTPLIGEMITLRHNPPAKDGTADLVSKVATCQNSHRHTSPPICATGSLGQTGSHQSPHVLVTPINANNHQSIVREETQGVAREEQQ